MCYIVIISLPKKHASAVEDVRQKQSFLQATPTSGVCEPKLLPEDYLSFAITRGGCACDLYVHPSTWNESLAVRKYRKKGWTDRQIRRAVEHNQSRPRRGGFHASVIEFVQNVSRVSRAVAVCVHWFSRDIESEVIKITSAGVSPLSELPERGQLLMKDELLLVVDREGGVCPGRALNQVVRRIEAFAERTRK